MKKCSLLSMLAGLLFSVSANAHHDISDEVDLDNPITFREKVIGVE